MSTFAQRSIEIIRGNQFSTGAYIASPAFSHYRYSWLRDGSFIAYAMDVSGEHESAKRFYDWCSMVILKHENKARQAIQAVFAEHRELDERLFLHTRYTPDGEEVQEHWGNFQLDGYGTWLWGLGEHLRRSGRSGQFDAYRPAVNLTLDYLLACWHLPNYDCWEEFPDRVHPATLAAIYGGFQAMAAFLPERKDQLREACEKIRAYVLAEGVDNGAFTKSVGSNETDASLLWIAVPFGLAEGSDPVMKQTVERIEEQLVNGYGVHRYRADVYYGGGQWILLSAWLGWYYVRTGQAERAQAILAWIEGKFTDVGLPEQVQDVLLAPEKYDEWVKRAGPPANPLLWSHAMYLVLRAELQ